MNRNSKCVMVFGTFDVFHAGHRYFINKAKIKNEVKGNEIIIVVARDKTVKRLKGVLRNSEKKRQKVLQENFPEAKVVLGDLVDYLAVVRKYKPDLIYLGYDQVGFSKQLRKQFPSIMVKRIGAYRPEKYKSSKM